jgi:NSS family neurotransmitter:Na+ symporter
MEKSRGQWGTSLGFVLAAAGSAVGLGNIWKFPRMAYNYGGGTFILVYLLIVVFIGFTVMMTEFTIGRHTQKNAVGALRQINKNWTFLGAMGIFTGFVILAYYAQVAGWVLKYAVTYLTGPSSIYANPEAFLVEGILGASSFPVQGAIIFPAIIMAITVFIVVKGVSGGIEKANKILMPALVVMLLILFVRGMTLSSTREGMATLLSFNLADINTEMILVALGQAFFSLSLGMGVMVTYGSYLKKNENMSKNALTICGLDTAIALIAGFAIIPIALSAGLEIPGGSGSAGFGFISMATAFESMAFGSFFGFLFYFLMFFAAITSAISILEGTVAYLVEEKKFDRKKAAIVLGVIMFAIGLPYTLSQANMTLQLPWIDANGLNMVSVGDFMEFLTDRLLMPVGSLLFCIFVGWVWGPDKAVAEAEQDGIKFGLKTMYKISVKYIAPLAIIAILLQSFGIITF